MQSGSLKEIKSCLENMTKEEMISICVRLSKFKKENKELISYLLFEEKDEQCYIQSVKNELDESFNNLHIDNLYFAKKNIRKIIRMANRYIKYSDVKTTEVELLIHVCKKIKESAINLNKSQALINIYNALLKKINKAVDNMHEDLQFDFRKEITLINLI